ncbi:MAG: hypothetical protein A2W17_01465 [Planctomycetes bacterium RBG_16_41_13]|nr:MAG: hypothetical protein A2W17_01465 [Planctomycetes bacterium RBG_16_41_13]
MYQKKKIKYAGDEWELVRHPGYWMLQRLGVKSYFRNDKSLEEFKAFLKDREREGNNEKNRGMDEYTKIKTQ